MSACTFLISIVQFSSVLCSHSSHFLVFWLQWQHPVSLLSTAFREPIFSVYFHVWAGRGLSQAENQIRINLEHEYCDTNSLIYYFSDSTEKVGLKLLSVFVWNCKFCIVCEKLGESGVVTWKNPFLFFTIFKYHN